jgi:hypothetical protein
MLLLIISLEYKLNVIYLFIYVVIDYLKEILNILALNVVRGNTNADVTIFA